MSFDQQHYVDLGKQPINTAHPCGESVRYEADFQQLESEVEKLESLNNMQVDWPLVISTSKKILNQQSKDLLVASYLCQGLLKQYQVDGLHSGLQIIYDLISNFWLELLPPLKRLRARNSALQWLSEHAQPLVNRWEVNADNAQIFIDCYDCLNDILSTMEQQADAETASMLELLKELREKKKQASQWAITKQNVDDNSCDTPPDTKMQSNQAKPKNTMLDNTERALSEKHLAEINGSKAEKETTIEDTPSTQSIANASLIAEHPLIKLGCCEIQTQPPCGKAAKYEPDFEALEAQLSKQTSLTNESVDWQEVARLAEGILQHQSKDLLVAAYFARALLEKEKYRGLLLGITIMSDLCQNFWQDCFPPIKRLRARESALNWFSEKIALYIEQQTPTDKEYPLIIEAYDKLYDFTNELDRLFDGSGPSLLELSKALKQYQKVAKASLEQAKNKEEVPQSTEKTPQSTASKTDDNAQASVEDSAVNSEQSLAENSLNSAAAAKAATPNSKPSAASKKNIPVAPTLNTQSPSNDNQAKKSLRSIQDALRIGAEFHLQQALTNAKAYRQYRLATWLMIESSPPNKDSITQLPTMPVLDKRKQFSALFEANKFEDLLKQIESSLSKSPFWLDGQYYVAKSLQTLGEPYQDAYDCVMQEVAGVLRRCPNLEYLKFVDGTAFANEQTLMWINNEVRQSQGGGSAEDMPWSDSLKQAKILMASKKVDAALDLFEQGIQTSSQQRQHWQWRYAFCELLLNAGKLVMGCHVLEALLKELQQKQLLQWDADIAKQAATTLYKTSNQLYKNNKKESFYLTQRQFSFEIIAQLDPITATKLQE